MTVGYTGLTNYSSLNGLSGSYGSLNYSVPSFTGNYGSIYGYYYGMDVDDAKENLQNNYDLTTLQQSYGNMQSVQNLDWATLCSNVSTLLQQGRTDDAIAEYNKLVKSMSEASQYEGYNESQIKALAQQMYAQTLGTSLVNDIDTYASGSFVQGLKSGVPIFGTLLAQANSKEDMLSEVTGVNQSKGAVAAKILGNTITGGGLGAGAGILTAMKLGKGKGKYGLIGGAIGAVIAFGKQLFS